MRTARAGFTLLEVLVAMALMSMLAATLYASLHVAFRARNSVERVGEQSRAGQLALDMVRRDLSQTLPPKGILAGAFTGTDIQEDNGTDIDSVTFYAAGNTPPADTPESDVCMVTIGLGEDDEGKRALTRNITTNLLASETPEPKTEVLCRNVKGLNLRYFDGTDWQDAWDSTQYSDSAPLAIEVTLTLKPDAEAAALAASAPAGMDEGTVLTRIVLLPCASAPSTTVTTAPATP